MVPYFHPKYHHRTHFFPLCTTMLSLCTNPLPALTSFPAWKTDSPSPKFQNKLGFSHPGGRKYPSPTIPAGLLPSPGCRPGQQSPPHNGFLQPFFIQAFFHEKKAVLKTRFTFFNTATSVDPDNGTPPFGHKKVGKPKMRGKKRPSLPQK